MSSTSRSPIPTAISSRIIPATCSLPAARRWRCSPWRSTTKPGYGKSALEMSSPARLRPRNWPSAIEPPSPHNRIRPPRGGGSPLTSVRLPRRGATCYDRVNELLTRATGRRRARPGRASERRSAGAGKWTRCCYWNSTRSVRPCSSGGSRQGSCRISRLFISRRRCSPPSLTKSIRSISSRGFSGIPFTPGYLIPSIRCFT